MSRFLVYLAHPGYQTPGSETSALPLNIGYLKAYADQHIGLAVDIRLFMHVEPLLAALRKRKPHLLALSNYVWNSVLSDSILQYARSLYPNLLTLQGGHHYPLNKDNGFTFWQPKKDYLDFYLHGEGEEAFRKFLLYALGCEGTVRKGEIDIAGIDYWSDKLNAPVMQPEHERIKNIEENIPSPILSGALDEFILEIPMLQTTRGCPYSCQFCHEAQPYYNRLYAMSVERVIAEINYIRAFGNKYPYMHITDANFGILKRDINILNYLIKLRKDTGWPIQLYASTPKKPSQEFIEAALSSDGIVRLGLMFQSMNKETLKIIKRIPPQDYEIKVFKEYMAEDKSEHVFDTALVIPMPRETFKSYLKAMRQIIDEYRPSEGTVATMMIFWGIPFENKDFQKEHDMVVKYRFSESAFGHFSAFNSCEVEQVCVGTATFSEEEYYLARSIYFFCVTFYFKRNFLLLRRYLRDKGISIFDWILYLQDNRRKAAPKVKEYFDDFDRMTREELSDTEDEIRSFLEKPENIQKINDHKVGFNVIHMALGNLLDYYEDVVDYAHVCTRELLDKSGIEHGHELEDIIYCMKHLRLSRMVPEEIERNIVNEFRYNIYQWQKDNFSRKLEDYYVSQKVTLAFRFSPEAKRRLVMALENYDMLDKSVRSKFFYRIHPESYNRTMECVNL
jgi:radical SAM superfamily enzyme YgiQ (UPF0313 family)